MFFQLLHGIHTELGKKFQVKVAKGAEDVSQPVIVESEHNLVRMFGSDKFRPLTDEQASLLLKTDKAPGEVDTSATSPGASVKPVEKTVNSLGKDVTDKFLPALENNLKVYYKNHRYMVTDSGGRVLTIDGPIQRAQVNTFAKRYEG